MLFFCDIYINIPIYIPSIFVKKTRQKLGKPKKTPKKTKKIKQT